MKKIVNNTLVVMLGLILTACGGGDSSDLNSTKERVVETSSSNEEVTRVEVSSSEEIPNSNSTERENFIVELPTVANYSESDIQTSTSNGGFTVNTGTNQTVSVVKL